MVSDLNRLQGTWRVVSLELDGRPVPGEAIGESRIVIEGTRFTSVGMAAAYEGTFECDDRRTPKTFDLLFTAGPEQGNRNLGIYTLDRTRWTMCLATRGSERPARFVTEGGSGIALQTLERETASRRRRSKPAAPVPSSSSGPPATVLEGEWEMVSAVFSGAPLEAAMVKWCRRVTRGDVTTVLAGPQVMLKASFTTDLSSHPDQIDYLNLDGPNKGKSQAGIFDLQNDILRICMGAPGEPRPVEFVSMAGDRRSLTVWRKK